MKNRTANTDMPTKDTVYTQEYWQSKDTHQGLEPHIPGTVPIIDLYSGGGDSLSSECALETLKDEIIRGLQGSNNDNNPAKETNQEEGEYAYTKTLPSMVLYDQRGLILYDLLTATPEYYLYNAEMEILKEHGHEIVMRIFGQALPESQEHAPTNKPEYHQQQQVSHESQTHLCLTKENLDDGKVDRYNSSVQTNDSLGTAQSVGPGSLIELGAGSLKKTIHLIRALSILPKLSKGPSVIYFALDLERSELVRTLEDLRAQETKRFDKDGWTILDGKVGISGMWATYDTGIEFIHEGGIGKFLTSRGDSCVNTEGRRCLMWLGSSIGSYNRNDAGEYLKNVTTNCLRPGDVMLISIDRRNNPSDVALAYNDPAGRSRDFIMNGLAHVNKIFGCEVIDSSKFRHVSHYDSREGKHDAFIQSKIDQKLQLPGKLIEVSEDELILVVSSYKYSEEESLDLFDNAGLQVVQRWTNKAEQYDTWLVKRQP